MLSVRAFGPKQTFGNLFYAAMRPSQKQTDVPRSDLRKAG